MGMGQQIISVYSDLFNEIDFSSHVKKSVCELGRQNLTITKNIDSFQNDQQYMRRFAKKIKHKYA